MSEKKSKPAQIKTKPTAVSPEAFLEQIADEQKKQDCRTLCNLMQKITGEPPVMWGPSIVGFGNKRYKSPATGREVDWLLIGFSPRKANISLYLTMNIQALEAELKKLGKHKTGVGCLYINKLSDVDLKILESMIQTAVSHLKSK